MDKFFAAALLALGISLGSAHAADLELGSLRISGLDGYERSADSNPIQLRGPGGVNVLISIWTAPTDGGSGPTADAQSKFIRIAESRLPGLAAAQGKVVIPLHREILPDGSILYSTATQAGSHRKPEFYLQYMLVAPSARAALFTVEGPGEAMLQHSNFLQRVLSVVWADAP